METHILILTVTGVILGAAAVVLLVKLWSLVGELELFLRETRHETTPMLQKSDKLLERLNNISDVLEQRIEDADRDIDSVLNNLTTISEDIRSLSEQWRSKLQPNGRWSGWISTVVASGYQAFQKYREKKHSKEGGKTDE